MLKLRDITQDDVPFILDSFTEEFSQSVYASGLTRSRVRKLLHDMLFDGWGSIAQVLCESDTPDEIIAWVAHRLDSGGVDVIWVHTKGIYRRKGFAKMLLGMVGVRPGNVKTPFIPSPKFARLARQHGWNLLHRPWMGMT